MTQPHRQYGIGSLAPDEKIVGKPGGLVEPGVKQYGIFKKIKKIGKKIFKSPIGKAALLGGGLWGLGKLGGIGSSGIGKNWWSKGLGFGKNLLMGKATGQGPAGKTMPRSGGLWNWVKNNKGQAALLGLGTAGTIAPFLGGDEDEEVIDDWSVTPSSIANIRKMAKAQDPSLAFLPPAESVMSGYYGSKEGGIVGMANGGGAGNAQAEQMLKMEYQKYRNQGGTMSYQQFKMAVLQQAQGQGPMAQGQQQAPQMAAHGGRIKYQGGELVEDASMVEETPTGMMEENVEEVQGEPTREQMEALAMEIFQLRLEELDEEQLMVVYQAAMKQQPEAMAMQEDVQFAPQMAPPQMAANGGRIGFQPGGPAGGASAGGNYGGNVNPQQEYAGRTFAETYGGGGGGDGGGDGGNNTTVTNTTILPEYGYNWRNILPGGKPFYGPLKVDEDEDNKLGAIDYGKAISDEQSLYGKALTIKQQKAADALALQERFKNLAHGGRVGLAHGGPMGSHVPGYATPPGYNQFDYPSGGVRVGRAEGGIMDLGGMEKDYRQEGGFVPLGGKEKADDVPARLSKNEFVFTADAVRNAGGGDIDQGAEVMQNMMENLEQGGEISEESQGAQGMYNNMQQLQTRIE